MPFFFFYKSRDGSGRVRTEVVGHGDILRKGDVLKLHEEPLAVSLDERMVLECSGPTLRLSRKALVPATRDASRSTRVVTRTLCMSFVLRGSS